jgi:hypothetical protein
MTIVTLVERGGAARSVPVDDLKASTSEPSFSGTPTPKAS